MTKRVAERQLTQDNQYDEDDSSVGDSALKQANVPDLASRKILKPKSRRVLSECKKEALSVGPTFSGFGGFATAADSCIKVPVRPRVQIDEEGKERFSKLRGLNESFRQHISTQLEINPFADFAKAFKQYSQYRSEILNKAELRQASWPPSRNKTPTIPSVAENERGLREEPGNAVLTVKSTGGSAAPKSKEERQDGVKTVSDTSDEKSVPHFTFKQLSPPPVNSFPPTASLFKPPKIGVGESKEPDVSASKDGKVEETSVTGSNLAVVEENPLQVQTADDQVNRPDPDMHGRASEKRSLFANFSFSTTNGKQTAAPSTTPAFIFGASQPQKPVFTFGGTLNNATDITAAATPKSKPGSGPHADFTFTVNTPKPVSFGSMSPPAKPLFSGVGFSFAARPQPVTESSARDAAGDAGKGAGTNEQYEEAVVANGKRRETGAGADSGKDDEMELYQVRTKVYRWNKTDNLYADLGIGLLTLRQSKGQSSRKRLLCRAEGSGRIIVNACLFAEMHVIRQEGKRDVVVVVFDHQSVPTRYTFRVRNADSARELAEAIEREKPSAIAD